MITAEKSIGITCTKLDIYNNYVPFYYEGKG